MKEAPLFVLLICVALCCDATNTRSRALTKPLDQIAKKLDVVGRLEAKVASVFRRARGLDYDVHKMYDMKFKCAQALEKWDEDALLAAVYEVDKAMIEGTFTLWDLSKDTTEFLLAIAGDTINVQTPTFRMETDKMDKTFLRVFDGFMRAAVASSPIGDNYKSWIDKEVQGALDDKKPALLGKDVEEGKKLADKVFEETDRVYRSRIDDKKKKKEKFPASCTLMDVVLTSHRDRLIENTVINTKIRDAVTSSINTVTNLAVTGLIAGSGVTVGVNPGVSFGLGIAAGAVKLGGALTEMIAEKAIKANDAVKEFRRGVRIQLIEALRAILNEGKCHDKFYDMMKLLHTMMVKEQFDGITRKEIRKTLMNDCVAENDVYSEYIWVADLLQSLTKKKLKRDKTKLDIKGLKANELAAKLPDLGKDIGDRVGKAITPPTPAKK